MSGSQGANLVTQSRKSSAKIGGQVILNAIGLQNPGVDYFIENILPELTSYQTKFIVNISGNTPEEYGVLAQKLSVPGVAALEVNISCPNVKAGGLVFGTDPDLVAEVISVVKGHTNLPVIAKLSPNVTDIQEIAIAAEEAGADAILFNQHFTGYGY